MSIATAPLTKSGADLAGSVRDVTPEEIAFYQEHGWVMLRELVSRETAAGLLEGAKEILPPARLKAYEESGRKSKIMYKRV